MGRPQVPHLREHAPAVDPVINGGRQCVDILIGPRRSAGAELVDDRVLEDARDPRVGPCPVAELIRARQRPRQTGLYGVLGIRQGDAAAASRPHETRPVPRQAGNRGTGRTGLLETSHGATLPRHGCGRTRSSARGQKIRRKDSRGGPSTGHMSEAAPCTASDCHGACAPPRRPQHLRRALGLEYLTVGWNVLEGVIAVTAALVALLGFGIDSFVECASGGVMIWRLRAESRGVEGEALERTEHMARRGVAATLTLLAAYVAFDAATVLWKREHPRVSGAGIAVTAVSLGVMWWLAREKRRVADAIDSQALKADAFQTTACWWLSLATLAGIALNGALGWWWADPVAGLVVAALVATEARSAWRGEDCC